MCSDVLCTGSVLLPWEVCVHQSVLIHPFKTSWMYSTPLCMHTDPTVSFTVCVYLSGYVSMVPAMAPDVSSAQFQLLLQLLAKFLRRRLQQVLLLGELHGTNMRGKQDITYSSYSVFPWKWIINWKRGLYMTFIYSGASHRD